MMVEIANVYINDKNKPTNIPDCDTIITHTRAMREAHINGICIPLDKNSETDVSAIWVKVKYGDNSVMCRARTQQFVEQYLKNNSITTVRAPRLYLAFMWGGYGFIVSEYIDGQLCDDGDIPILAAAVQDLVAIPGPSSTPGPVGGGCIEHPFFYDRPSPIWYESVDELQAHINGVRAHYLDD